MSSFGRPPLFGNWLYDRIGVEGLLGEVQMWAIARSSSSSSSSSSGGSSSRSSSGSGPSYLGGLSPRASGTAA